MKAAVDTLNAIALAAGGAGVLGGAVALAHQSYQWLRFSYWEPLSVITALRWLEVPWALRPQDWFGLHKLLDGIPLFVGLPVVGLVIAGFLSSFASDMRR